MRIAAQLVRIITVLAAALAVLAIVVTPFVFGWHNATNPEFVDNAHQHGLNPITAFLQLIVGLSFPAFVFAGIGSAALLCDEQTDFFGFNHSEAFSECFVGVTIVSGIALGVYYFTV